MLNRAVLTIFSWNPASFCFQLSRTRQVLQVLVFLTLLVGMIPKDVHAAWGSAAPAVRIPVERVNNRNDIRITAMDGDNAATAAFTLLPVTVTEPLGHWEFDESSWAGDCSTADILDSSGNNHHGTACVNGDAPYPVPGKFGNAGRFDGINEYANMGPGFNFTSSFTASMWIALDDYDWCGPTGKSQHIIGTHHVATPTGIGRGWGIYWDCSGLAWELTNSTGSAIGSYGYVQPSPFPVNGSWHHIALAYDSSVPSATLYWDGDPIYLESGTANVPSFLFNNGEPLTVNGLPYAPSSGAPGKIDDTRVYNRVLSGDEIQMLFGNQPHVTFGDVLTDHWAWSYIETLFNAGVTSGCSTLPTMYCPATTVTRDQMAVFLLRGKHSSSYTPPPAAGIFQDVPTNYWAADWIEQLAMEGITSGCNVSPRQYCPATEVTRDQMAVFLLRAKHGSGYVPPPATGVFQDVPTNYWAADWIEQLAMEGITSGCSESPKLYCPSTTVTRDQMAVFLVRNFSLP